MNNPFCDDEEDGRRRRPWIGVCALGHGATAAATNRGLALRGKKNVTVNTPCWGLKLTVEEEEEAEEEAVEAAQVDDDAQWQLWSVVGYLWVLCSGNKLDVE